MSLPNKMKKSSEERRLIERFQNSEKFFIQLLKNAMTTYLTDLPDDLCNGVDTFLKSFRRITKFHTEFYPQLIQCEMRTINICDLIKTHLDNSDFNIYFKYAAYAHEALQMIRYFHLNSVRNFQSHHSLLCGLCLGHIICLVAGQLNKGFNFGFTF